MLDTTVRANFSERAVVLSESYLWEASPTPGVHRVKLDRIGLEVARATSLVHYEPNQRFPFHRHDGGHDSDGVDHSHDDDDWPDWLERLDFRHGGVVSGTGGGTEKCFGVNFSKPAPASTVGTSGRRSLDMMLLGFLMKALDVEIIGVEALDVDLNGAGLAFAGAGAGGGG